jgi:glycosyltransferase involved in cell wall biosynthesis
MRICLISYEFLPKTGFGGAAALYTDLSTALHDMGHDVVVLSGNDRHGLAVDRAKGFVNVQFGHKRLRPRPLACVARTVQVLHRFERVEKESGRFDVVESPELQAEPLLMNMIHRDCPVITRLVTPHYLLHKMNQKRRLRSVDWFERENANRSSLILGDAKEWAEDILRTWGIDLAKLRICPLGIDLRRIDQVKESPVDFADRYILFAGRLTLAKGPQVLSSAASEILREHPDVKIVFAGADTLTESGQSVREMVKGAAPKEFQASLVFSGFVKSWDDLVNLYRHAAVCVKADAYTNHSYDTMGQMACGRPMLCTNNEAHADLIKDGESGFLFEKDDPHQLAARINRLLSDQELSKRMGRAARRTIEERFTSQKCAQESLRIYEESIALRQR